MNKTFFFIVVIAIAGAAGFGLQRYLSTNNQTIAPQVKSSIIGSQRIEFAMVDIEGKTRNIKDWDGQVILLNFWATWCPPCLKEIPDFIEVQEDFRNRGFQIIGIAVDDEDEVREFAAERAMNYPVMAGEIEAIELSKKYGNSIGGLPYSAIIDKNGKITHTITGELSKQRLLSILKELGFNA